MSDTFTPLASATDFTDFGDGLAELVRDFSSPAKDKLMLRATRAVESRCDRRFAPFTITETIRAHGIDPAAAESGGLPMDLLGALGRSRARAFGATNQVRDVWLREYAPLYADMWTYTVSNVTLARAWGDTQTVNPTSLEGPEPDSGHLRFRLGTFIPVGTTIRVTYSGGYTLSVPEDLVDATIYTAAKLAIVATEPQSRSGMNLDELDGQILELLAPFIRS